MGDSIRPSGLQVRGRDVARARDIAALLCAAPSQDLTRDLVQKCQQAEPAEPGDT